LLYTSLLGRLEEAKWLSLKVIGSSGFSPFSKASKRYRFHRRRTTALSVSIRTSISCFSINIEYEGGNEGSDVGRSVDRPSLVRLLPHRDLRLGTITVPTARITLLERDQTIRVRFRQRGKRSSQRVQRVEGRL
jgi:hypothetical protein